MIITLRPTGQYIGFQSGSKLPARMVSKSCHQSSGVMFSYLFIISMFSGFDKTADVLSALFSGKSFSIVDFICLLTLGRPVFD